MYRPLHCKQCTDRCTTNNDDKYTWECECSVRHSTKQVKTLVEKSESGIITYGCKSDANLPSSSAFLDVGTLERVFIVVTHAGPIAKYHKTAHSHFLCPGGWKPLFKFTKIVDNKFRQHWNTLEITPLILLKTQFEHTKYFVQQQQNAANGSFKPEKGFITDLFAN